MTAEPPPAEDRQMTEFRRRQIGHTGLQVIDRLAAPGLSRGQSVKGRS